MASNERIDEFIDEKAYAQFDRLRNELRISQNEFGDLIKTIKDLNIELSKSSGVEGLSNAIKKANEVSEKMASSQKEQAEIYSKVAQAQERVVEATKAKISVAAMDEAVLRKVSGSLDEQIRRQIQLKAELASLKEEQKELSKAVISSDASIKAVTAKTTQLAKEEAILKAALQQTNLEIRRQTKEQLSAEGSSDQLASRLDQLRGAYRALSDEERSNIEIGGYLLSQINELDATLKELDASQGVYNRKVGNYASGTENLNEALSSVVPGFDKVKKSIDKTIEGLSSIKNALSDYVNGVNASRSAQEGASKATLSSSKALNIFKLALASTGIGLIIVALGSLITYLTKTQEGIDKVTAVTRPLMEIFKSFMGVAENIGKTMLSAFSNPRKAIQDMYNFVKDEVLPLFMNYGRMLLGIATFDADMIKEGFNGIADSVKRAASEVSGFFGEAIERGKEIDDLYKDIERSEINLIKTQGELNRTIEEQKEIARDVTKSEDERRKAAEKATEAINTLSEQQLAIQEKRIALHKLENAATAGTLADVKALAELEAERDNIAANAARQRRQLLNVNRNEAKNSAKALEIRIKNEEAAEKRLYELMMLQIDHEKARTERLAQLYKKNADDEGLAYNDRLDNLNLYINKRNEAIELSFEKERIIQEQKLKEAISLEKEGREEEAEAVRKIVEENLKAIGESEAEIRRQVALDNAKIASDIFKTQMQDEQRERLETIENGYNEERLLVAQMLANRNITEEESEIRRLEIGRKYSTALIENEIKTIEAIIEANKERGISTRSEEQKIADLKMRLSKQATDAQIEDLERLREREKEDAEIRKEIAKELFDFSTEIFQTELERSLAENERKQEELEADVEAKKAALEFEVLTEEEKANRLAEIELEAKGRRRQLEKEEAKIKEKQAKFEKAQAIVSIILSTARAVAAALPAIPLSIAVGAIGAAQLAYAISQPIPKFAKGTSSSPEGLAYVGEQGSELIISPTGDVSLTPDRTTLTYLEKGSKVYTASQTREMLANMSITGGNMSNTYEVNMTALIEEQKKSTKELKDAFLNKPEYRTILTERGLKGSYARSKKWNNYKNSLLN